ncbi:hypothetical protein VK70_01230 [Paenibacillus durus ATCC 35681]|uniref:Uncharacterized protein n=1 Tax=Paenibacillus durus ATCC 35681 TaxID=1333534 RepID=A0A0F7F7M6_PAEDU|nr:hypothetical protein VK70_01230 [Paenibacillus durus ATCC 35681]
MNILDFGKWRCLVIFTYNVETESQYIDAHPVAERLSIFCRQFMLCNKRVHITVQLAEFTLQQRVIAGGNGRSVGFPVMIERAI